MRAPICSYLSPVKNLSPKMADSKGHFYSVQTPAGRFLRAVPKSAIVFFKQSFVKELEIELKMQKKVSNKRVLYRKKPMLADLPTKRLVFDGRYTVNTVNTVNTS